MVRKCVWSGLTLVLGLAVLALAGHDETSAQSTAGLYRPVIIAYSQAGNPTHTDGDDAGYLNSHPVQIREDGSGFQYIHCVRYWEDITSRGMTPGGDQRFIIAVRNRTPGSSPPEDQLLFTSEDATAAFSNPSYEVLARDAGEEIQRATWSPDGTRIAFSV